MAKRPPAKQRDDTIAGAARAAESINGTGGTVTLSTGVVLSIHPVPPYAFQSASMQAGPPPEPPMVYIESRGREEPNPDDPAYKQQFQRHRVKQSDLVSNVLFLYGTKIQHVPDGVPKVEDDDWLDLLKATGVEVDSTNSYERYLAWLRYVVLAKSEDITNLVSATMRGSGTTEEDVQQALETFRSDEERGED